MSGYVVRNTTVKATLTPKAPARKSRTVETAEYAAFGRRMLRAWARRVGDGDPHDLTELLATSKALDTLIREAVTAQRAVYGTSWTTIGAAAGTTRQAAQQRWGGNREPG